MTRWSLIAALTLCALPAVAAKVHKQGSLDIYEYDSVDLDEGTSLAIVTLDGAKEPPQQPRDKGLDFWYQPVNKGHYLSPLHGTRFAKISPSQAGFAGCANASYPKGRLRFDGLRGGELICVRTNEGRFSEITLENFAVKSPGFSTDYETIKISYITWEK